MFSYKAKRIAVMLDDLLLDAGQEGKPAELRFEIAAFQAKLERLGKEANDATE